LFFYRTSFRSGTQQPPAAAKDLYERLFWFGFDPDESEGVGDKTVFGGTKGKFNGLSYLLDGEGRTGPPPPKRAPRGLPSPGEREYDDDYDLERKEYRYDEPRYKENTNTEPRSQYIKPPKDTPYPRTQAEEAARRQSRKQRRQQRSTRTDENYDEDDYSSGAQSGGEWVSKQVSSWFDGDDEDDDDDYVERDDRVDRRRRRKKDSGWSPFNIFDSFFGVNRDELNYQAEVYDKKMGLGPQRSGRRQRASRESAPRRPGYRGASGDC
jgi:hypothetical protein